jgi:hypothetical protein
MQIWHPRKVVVCGNFAGTDDLAEPKLPQIPFFGNELSTERPIPVIGPNRLQESEGFPLFEQF